MGWGGDGDTETSSLHPPAPSQSRWEAVAQETRDSCGRLQLLLRRPSRPGAEKTRSLSRWEAAPLPPPVPGFAFRALSQRGAAPPPLPALAEGREEQGDRTAVAAGGRAEPRSPAPRLGKG